MTKSATDIMEEIIFTSVLDAIMALKAASKGMPNTLLRDINAIHANVTRADLPADVQAAIQANVRAAFARLLKEGYSVAPSRGEPQRSPAAPAAAGARADRRPFPGGPGPRRDRPERREGPGRPDTRNGPGRGGPPRGGGGGAGGGGGGRPPKKG